jgi:hypothetical protein
MWRERLTQAAWCSIASAILAVPSLVLSMLVGKEGWGSPVWLADVFLTTISMTVWVYSAFTLRDLLFRLSVPQELVTSLSAYIWIGIASTVVLTLFPMPDALKAVLSFGCVFAIGVAGLVFSVQFMRCRQDLFGLRGAFAYTHLAHDICLLSCILVLVAIPIGMANNVILAVLFFRAADAGESTASNEGAPDDRDAPA